MNVPFYIAKRYVFSKSKSSAINIITGITAVGILVGAMVMFVVLSVFSGLRDFSLSFINDFDPDLKLVVTEGKTLTLSAEQEKKLREIDGIAHYSKIVEERVLLRYDAKEHIAYIKGVDSSFVWVNPVEDHVFFGQWLVEADQVAVGYKIAQKLSIGVFDYENEMQLLVPKAGKGSISQDDFNKIAVRPLGIYSFEDEDLDARYVFASLPLVQTLLSLDENQISGIEIKLEQGASESHIKSELAKIFPTGVGVKNRTELNDALHKMLNTENFVVYLVVTLVIIITLFTLIGTIIMMIIDKRTHLKTLSNIGMRVKDLRNVFLYQGFLLSLFGCIIGLILGIIVVLLQQQFSFWMLTSTLAYPVKFTFQNVVVVFVTIMFLSFLASKIASKRVVF